MAAIQPSFSQPDSGCGEILSNTRRYPNMEIRNKLIPFLFAALLLPDLITAQPAIIRGNIAAGKGEIVRAVVESNPFTRQVEVIATDTCDANGNFRFALQLAGPVLVGLDVWFHCDYFWIEPGDTLGVIAPEPIPVGFSPLNEPAGFLRSGTDTLTTAYLINRFDQNLADFLDSNFTTLFRKGDRTLARNFIEQKTKEAENTNNLFATAYIRYSLLQLALDTRVQSPKAIASTIFAARPDYTNPAFMNLVTRIFGEYHLKSAELNQKDLINQATKGDYNQFLDLLGKDSLLTNEIIRELAAIQIITDIANALPPSKRQGALNLLDSMALRTKFSEHRRLAQLVKNQAGALLPQSPCPPILSSDTAYPDSLLGKPAVLMFVHTQCPGCLEAANWLAAFKMREHWNCRVVTIFMDRLKTDFQTYTNKETWPWTSIWGGNDVNMAHRWQIKSLPLTVFIDRTGKIILHPAPEPGVDSEKLLLKMTEIKPGERRRK